MYRLARKVHLWVGLILAIVLIVEAATGLILAEPALFGAAKTQGQGEGWRHGARLAQGQGQGVGPGQGQGARSAPSGVYGLAKGLHQGKVGGMDLKWVIDLSGIGLVVLTVTGVYMGVVCLRAERRRG